MMKRAALALLSAALILGAAGPASAKRDKDPGDRDRESCFFVYETPGFSFRVGCR